MADEATPPEPKVLSTKEFSLKPIETELLRVLLQQQGSLMSNTLSFIAIERLAVTVGPGTRFNLAENLDKVTITEVEVPTDTGDIVEQASTPKKG